MNWNAFHFSCRFISKKLAEGVRLEIALDMLSNSYGSAYADAISTTPVYTELLNQPSVARQHELATIYGSLAEYYIHNLSFPRNNAEAGLPDANKLISNKVSSVEVSDGAFHILLGNKVPEPLKGKYLTFRPAVVDGSPASPISWLCGYAKPVDGMQAIGDNRTNINTEYLPSECLQ